MKNFKILIKSIRIIENFNVFFYKTSIAYFERELIKKILVQFLFDSDIVTLKFFYYNIIKALEIKYYINNII